MRLSSTILLLGKREDQWKLVTEVSTNARKPGRPRVIPEDIEPVVVKLWESGYGYRAIARMLNAPEYGINAHFSSIRKTLIRLGKVNGK
jgi:hypothetical protein